MFDSGAGLWPSDLFGHNAKDFVKLIDKAAYQANRHASRPCHPQLLLKTRAVMPLLGLRQAMQVDSNTPPAVIAAVMGR